MNADDVDARLRALLAAAPEPSCPEFGDRVLARVACLQAERRARRRLLRRASSEAAAMIAVLASFILLAQSGSAGFDTVDPPGLTSPAVLGVTLLLLWAVVGLRPAGER